jgi:hypothetical protein
VTDWQVKYDACDYDFSSAEEAETNRKRSIDRFEQDVGDFYFPSSHVMDWPVPVPVAEKKETQGDLKTVAVRYAEAMQHQTGYAAAYINLKYGFIACMGEIHVAYSLDPNSVDAHNTYYANRSSVDASGTPVPKPPSIGFRAEVIEQGEHKIGASSIADVSDNFAGPALGYGCFTGQSKKVGDVAKLVGAKATPQQIQNYLDRLYLDRAAVHPFEPLTNAALEGDGAERARRQAALSEAERQERMRQQTAEALKANEANWAKAKAETDAKIAARKALEDQLARLAAEAKIKHQQNLEIERQDAENRARYEREMADWKAKYGNPQ